MDDEFTTSIYDSINMYVNISPIMDRLFTLSDSRISSVQKYMHPSYGSKSHINAMYILATRWPADTLYTLPAHWGRHVMAPVITPCRVSQTLPKL